MSVEQVLEALGMGFMSETEKTVAVERIRHVARQRVISSVLAAMPRKQKTRMPRPTQQGDVEAVWEWLLEEKLDVNVSDLYATTLQGYVEELRRRIDDL